MHISARLLLTLTITAAAVGCSGNSNSPSTPTPSPSGGSAVSIVSGASSAGSNAYSPNPITVARGGSVTWTNRDTVAHTSTSNDGSWGSGSIAPGGSFTMTFQTAGTFPYHCTIHANMVGTVTVQ